MSDDRRIETRVIHVGEGQSPDAAPLTTPIYETTTFLFDTAEDVRRYNEGRSGRFQYSRYENPTVTAVERKIAVLEGAGAALAFSSGMGAVATTLVALLRAGDEVVCSAGVYGGTRHLIDDVLGKLGIAARFLTHEELRDPAAHLTDRSRVLWFESPANPTLRCVDVRAVCGAARGRTVVSVVDNTFASPLNQRPLALGADLVMHSATKYLGGHADLTGGAIAGPETLIDTIGKTRRLLGTVLDPQAAYQLGRSLKTLPVRIARHNANALEVAEFLERDARVSAVYYPALPSHPDHEVAARQMSGFGGMVCFDLEGSYERAARFYDRLRVIRRAASLGGVESLCSLPVLTSQWGYSDEQLALAGVTPGMVRLSIGLEDPADLVADVEQALA